MLPLSSSRLSSLPFVAPFKFDAPRSQAATPSPAFRHGPVIAGASPAPTRPSPRALIAQNAFAQRHPWAPIGFVAPFKFSPLNLPFAAPFKLEVRPEPADNSFAGAPKTGRVQSAPAATARFAPHLHMGRRPQGRRPEAADGPTGHGAASAAPRTSRRVPGARHPARATTHPFTPSRTDVRGGAHGHLAFVARALSRAALLRTKRSRAPDRGS